MEGTKIVSPVMEQKIRNRIASSNFKNRSPQYKNILRERFQSRIKAKRRILIDEKRKFDSNLNCFEEVDLVICEAFFPESPPTKNVPCIPLDQEIVDIDVELQIMEQIWEEMVDEKAQWLFQQMEAETEELITIINDCVFCPVCQRGVIGEDSLGGIKCSLCKLKLPFGTVSQFGNAIKDNMDEHFKVCDKDPQFACFEDEDLNGLFIICHDCGLFHQMCPLLSS